MANWIAKAAATFRSVADSLGLKKKVKSTPFDQANGKAPFNASGVAEVAPGRFVFIDNHDPSALFELALDSDGVADERISRRPLMGLTDGELRDPERPTRVAGSSDVVLIVSSSLSASPAATGRATSVTDWSPLRYRAHGDLHAEAMAGFRDWLLRQVLSLSAARVSDYRMTAG